MGITKTASRIYYQLHFTEQHIIIIIIMVCCQYHKIIFTYCI